MNLENYLLYSSHRLLCKTTKQPLSNFEPRKSPGSREKKSFFSFSHYVHYTMIKRGKSFFSCSHYVHYAIIKREKSFFSFSYYVHYTMIEREKSFFSFNHSVHYAMMKRKKFFFSFCYYVHYTMIKTGKSFFTFYHYVHYAMMKRKKNQDTMIKTKFFFYLMTMFTTPWSREKIFFHFSTTFATPRSQEKGKRNWFLLHHYLDYATIIKKYPFLISLRHLLCEYLLTSHYVTNEKLSKQYPP